MAAVFSDSIFAVYAQAPGQAEASVGLIVVKNGRSYSSPEFLNWAFADGYDVIPVANRNCRWLVRNGCPGCTLEQVSKSVVRIEAIRVPEGRDAESRELIMSGWGKQ
jgi:hypothetical protein